MDANHKFLGGRKLPCEHNLSKNVHLEGANSRHSPANGSKCRDNGVTCHLYTSMPIASLGLFSVNCIL